MTILKQTGGLQHEENISEFDITSYFANESADPLTKAFEKPMVVHPGGKTAPLPPPKVQETYIKLLETPRSGKTAVYIHVPFCETHCLYCGFYRKRYDAEQSHEYTEALITELSASADTPCQTQGPVHSIYIGGGTPTALEADDLKRILLTLKDTLPLANDCEITVEGRLRNFGPDKMEACLEGGANRFSLGVQTFDTKIRQSMQRMADKEEVIKGLTQLASYDQAVVIIDLIYGFPSQTMEMWEADINTLLGLEIDGADLYQLKTFPGTPLFTAIKNEKMPPAADQDQMARMYARGVEMMDGAMYRRLTANHWGRTTRERNIYNHMMKSPADCLAFGPGAGGSLHGHFLFNESDYGKWRTAVMEEGRKPIAMMQVPTSSGPLEKTITAEMELCRINLERIGTTFGLPLAENLSPLYDQWVRAGLLEKKGDWFVLTTAGQFWQVNLAQLTINYLLQTLLKETS